MPDASTSPINFKKEAEDERATLLGDASERKASTTQHHKWGDQHCLISCKCPCHDHEDAVEHVHHGWIWKKTHAETWHCGLPIRVAVLSYSCVLMIALAGRIYALCVGESVIPWFTVPLIVIVILCCWVGLWLRSPNLMLVAAVLSGVLVTDTIVTFFIKFPFHDDSDDEEKKKSHTTKLVVNAIGLIFQLFFAFMNIFACISYRNHMISLQEYTDYHDRHTSARGLDGGLAASPSSHHHHHAEYEKQHIFVHYDEEGHAVV